MQSERRNVCGVERAMKAGSAKHMLVLVVAAAAVVCLQGCAAAGVTFLGVGAGVGVGTGTNYTLDGIAYRTFTESGERVRRATLASLNRMDVKVESDEAMEGGRKLDAEAGVRKVHIEFQELTPRTTRMRVTVKEGWFFRDRATAGEIIAQTERTLDDMPAVSHKDKVSHKTKQ